MSDKKVDEYIETQKSPQKEICIKLRTIIFKTFPDIKEKMKWGVPSYAGGKYYYIGSAEGHEYPNLQVGDEVDPRLSFCVNSKSINSCFF